MMAEKPGNKNPQERGQVPEAGNVNQVMMNEALKKLFNLSLDMLCVADFDGYFQFINPAFERTLGYSSQELLGTRFYEFIHHADRPGTQAAMEQLVAGESVNDFENRYRCKNGSYKWLAWTSVPVTDERYMYAVARDITDRKHAETALIKSEARLQTLFDSAAEFIFVIDPDGIIIKANRYVYEHSGYEPDEIIGSNIKEFFTVESQNICDCNFPALRERGSSRANIEFVCRNGRVIDMECSATAVPDEHGSFTTFLIIQRDVTERTRAATDLANSERRFRAIFNSTFQFIGLLDPEGIVLEANHTVRDYLGRTENDLVGKPFWEIVWRDISPEEQERIKTAIQTAKQGKLVRYQFDMTGNNNTVRTIDFSLKPVKNEQGEVTLLIPEGRDITELKRAEEELRHQQQEMAHVIRLSTMGEMASSMAHELNQPLTALLSYCGTAITLSKTKPVKQQKLCDILEHASHQAHRAGEIIRNLREFVGKETGHKEHIDINQVVGDLNVLLSPELRNANVMLDYQSNHQGRKVKANKVQIEQVLVNLVRNSIEAIQSLRKNGGMVILKTRLLKNDSIEVTVTDDGPGIEDDMIGVLFSPFHTSKESGMGMGLPISRTIIEAHGGKLWVDKDYPGGALFGFELPVSKQ